MRFLPLIAAAASTGLLAAPVAAAPSAPIPLWSAGAPGEQSGPGDEKDTTTPASNLVAGKRVARVGGIIYPTIQVFSPPKQNNTGAAIVVFPGGGYNILALDLEGTEVCEWLNSIGVTGVLLKYRVPPHKGADRYAAPLQDAQRAVRLVRAHAEEWGVDASRVGVLGFSAGGHLAAAASTNFDQETYPPGDAADKLSCRPDFAVLIYPAYLAVKSEGDKIAPEIKVSAQTPPSFLVQTEDDGVRVENSLFYYLALKNAKVQAEMHLFSSGGHGYGLRPTEQPVTGWPALAARWMHTIAVLK
jgi:acetyl esterase/lipase